MNRAFIIMLLITISFTKTLYANESVIGVWASPNIKSAKVLWFFYPDGKVRTSSNTSHNKYKMSWVVKNDELIIKDNSNKSSHTWAGNISDKTIKATHSFFFEGMKKSSLWTAEKYLSNPNKKVDFYSLCSNKKYVWEVVNIGNKEKCVGTVPWDKATSFSLGKTKKLCSAFIAKRKKEYKFKIEEICK